MKLSSAERPNRFPGTSHAFAVALLLLLLASHSMAIEPTSPTIAPPIPKVLAGLVPQLEAGTDVPILLPHSWPRENRKARLYASAAADANGWHVSVDSSPDCHEANACFVGYFAAKRDENAAAILNYTSDYEVVLVNGTKGSYRGKSCGGSCAPPQIRWMQAGTHYTIQFRVASTSEREVRDAIIEMANSAIRAGAR